MNKEANVTFTRTITLTDVEGLSKEEIQTKAVDTWNEEMELLDILMDEEHITTVEVEDITSEIITIRELSQKHPLMHSFDYKDRESEDFRRLSKVLSRLGYEYVNESEKNDETDYNDLKAHYNVKVQPIQ